MLASVFLVVYLGVARIQLGKKEPTPFATVDPAVRMAKAHKIAGYVILFLGNLACLTGVLHYVKEMLKNTKALPLGLLTLPLFAVAVLIFEINR